ncbi:SEL1 protein [Gigaspora margarita]|uniref:SEL1 protein n=1 Tax=Gigaspora margarita TaxID=4874 RepID=A0A8H3WZA1_GIGMA|nr:SEL1 protein [Gigaspora margarita]
MFKKWILINFVKVIIISTVSDESKAFEYYMKAAELGNAVAINDVGICYDDGIGVEKDEKKTFEYYMRAAELGNASANYNVGAWKWN